MKFESNKINIHCFFTGSPKRTPWSYGQMFPGGGCLGGRDHEYLYVAILSTSNSRRENMRERVLLGETNQNNLRRAVVVVAVRMSEKGLRKRHGGGW